MPKLSVYIPDDLWDEARKIDEDVKPSALLQDLLRERVREHRSRPYRRLTPDLEAALARARGLVVDRVAEAYQAGYAVALEFAENLPWVAFERLVEFDWDLRAWRESFEATDYEWMRASDEDKANGLAVDWEPCLRDAIEVRAEYLPVDAESVPIGVGAEGFVDAIRDLWLGSRDLAAGGTPGSLPASGAVQLTATEEG
jgi:hypothetical protein